MLLLLYKNSTFQNSKPRGLLLLIMQYSFIPNISVVLPFYNAEGTLQASIQSIVDQTYQTWELILVDNNSSDGSRRIGERFVSKDKRILLVEEEQQGVVHAMNKGLQVSKGKYIARMDADDIAYPEKLQKQFEYLEANEDVDVVSCKVEFQTRIENAKGFRLFVEWSNSMITSDDINRGMFVELPIVNPSILFRKKLIEDLGMYKDGDFPEDYEMFLRWHKAGVKMIKLPEVLFQWNDSADRLTRTDERYRTNSFFKIKTTYFYEWLKANNPYFPKVVVWGGGKKARQRFRILSKLGVEVEYYIDLKDGHRNGIKCIAYKDLPDPGNIFILSYVASRDSRFQIKSYLNSRAYKEMIDYVLLA